MRQIITTILITLLATLPASAQKLQSYTNKVKDGYNFWLSEPKDHDDYGERKPLVIFLHGASLKGNDLKRVLRYGTIDAIKRGLDIDAYVMAPQTATSWNPRKVKNTMDYVTSQFADIDTTRIYVIGMSLGGYGTLDFTAAYPDKVAAAMAICGGSTSNELAGLGQVPLWIVHGTGDRAVSVKESDRVVDRIRKVDLESPRLIYSRVPGMNHSEPARLFYMPRVYQWLFEHALTDPDRAMAGGFTIDSKMLRGAYSQIKSQRVSSVRDPADLDGDGLIDSEFVPAGFDDSDYELELIPTLFDLELEIEAENLELPDDPDTTEE